MVELAHIEGLQEGKALFIELSRSDGPYKPEENWLGNLSINLSMCLNRHIYTYIHFVVMAWRNFWARVLNPCFILFTMKIRK